MNHVHPKAMGFLIGFSTAILCTSNLSTDLILKSANFAFFNIFTSEYAPVVMSPDVGKFNCPIFHPLSFLPLIQLQTPFWLSVTSFIVALLAIAKN
jgi:hypothetical protein